MSQGSGVSFYAPVRVPLALLPNFTPVVPLFEQSQNFRGSCKARLFLVKSKPYYLRGNVFVKSVQKTAILGLRLDPGTTRLLGYLLSFCPVRCKSGLTNAMFLLKNRKGSIRSSTNLF